MDDFDNFESMIEDFDNTIVLTDEDGNEIKFEFIDLIKYEGNEYALLTSVDDEDDRLKILRVESDEDTEEETYESVDDEDVICAILNIFRKKFINWFNED